MRCFAPLLIVLVVSQCSYGYYGSDAGRLDKVEIEVEELQKQVKLLTKEVGRTSKPQCIQYEDIPSVIPNDFPAVLPLEVRRELTDNGKVKVNLKYWSSQVDLIPLWFGVTAQGDNAIEETLSNEIPQLPPGVRETQVLAPVGQASPYIKVVLPGGGQHDLNWLRLYINTSESRPDTQLCIALPEYHKQPRGDVVYEPGKDVPIKLTLPTLPESRSEDDIWPRELYHNRHAEMSVLDLSTGTLMERFSQEREIIEMLGVETYLTSQEIRVLLKSSQYELSGLVGFAVTDGVRTGDLVFGVMSQHVFAIRPITQAGSFPPGYLSFTEQHGSHHQHCDLSPDTTSRCLMMCTVVGTDITSLRMWKVENNGSKTEVLDFVDELTHSSELRNLWHYVPVQDVAIGDSRTYECEARNMAGEERAVRTEFDFYVQAKIDKMASGVVPINDTAVELVCAATGGPNVTLRFVLVDIDEMDPSVETYHAGLRTVARKTIHLSEDGSYPGYPPMCTMTQETTDASYPLAFETFQYENITASMESSQDSYLYHTLNTVV